ncbi:hypothetical protein HK102_004516 [Quaeritorhiza haematococci]|nr:hypothetical protein HK102_004516 [Quaeritorhiza haematococci]
MATSSFTPPTRPLTHPFLLMNPFTATTSSAPATTRGTARPTIDDDTECIMIEPHIHFSKSFGGLFVRADDAEERLKLSRIGFADTCYGEVVRYSPLVIRVFNQSTVVENVYQLPKAFQETSQYGGGIVGIDTLWQLGLSVAFDRGMVYLRDPEGNPYITTADTPSNAVPSDVPHVAAVAEVNSHSREATVAAS